MTSGNWLLATVLRQKRVERAGKTSLCLDMISDVLSIVTVYCMAATCCDIVLCGCYML